MIKVIVLELNQNCWEGVNVNNNEKFCYFESPAINKFLSEGWQIKDWKIAKSDIIFILEKTPEIPERICNTY